MNRSVYVLFLFFVVASCKKSKGNDDIKTENKSPLASIAAELKGANPFTFLFTAVAQDPDGDPLTFAWNFGNGTQRNGSKEETEIFDADKDFTITLTVSDGKSKPTIVSLQVSTKTTTISINKSQQFQTIAGFGGFGAQREYWSGGPFTSSTFVQNMIEDLGVTILRENIPTSFEIQNDNNDPKVIDLSRFNLTTNHSGHDGNLGDHLEYLRNMKAAGLQRLIVSVWSPAPWMKHNNQVGNGTQNQNSAPAYTTSPTSSTNQLKEKNYEEFAEMCAAYIRIIKQETGLDVYALSVQNEPRFSQFYASCVYNGEALRDVIKVVGKRLKDEGLSTKIFMPEDIGWLEGVEAMTKPTLSDPVARQYLQAVAVHGYDLDGATAASANAQTWQTMYRWGATHDLPLWMTETSGFENTHAGAMSLAKAMYTALRFGNVSAWLFWSLSTTNLDAYSLMDALGNKSKRYYVSKNFYRYIRPGAVRVDAAATEADKIYPLAFNNAGAGSQTIVLINDNKDIPKAIRLSGDGLPAQFRKYVTSENENAKDDGLVNSGDVIVLPPFSVVTLYDAP